VIRPLIVLILIAYAIAALGFGMAAIGAECAGQIVWASYYGKETCRPGKPCRTADGTDFDGTQMLVAHKTLPFGTMVRFTYNGRSVTVPVRDRGPFVGKREYDLSRAAAARIGMIEAGVVKLCAERV
jgi:rare lipoprotein A